ncbi:hypothetical protein KF707_04890 [Candidatus Obscuribacterales bacterium]|nr:hypothetical protein [Candidatus Obscuribacterales bacterium]MBX3135547.1 hypothetical protein [Candidatus Obscuribacterales bacterium]MBX3150602.1 hypothetical protein [Candidatus Obscuribacterales bacterium]
MNLYLWKSVTLLSCFVVFELMASPANADDAWIFKQQRAGEPLEVIVSKNAVKATLPSRGWAMVAAAPDWTAKTFNTHSKLYFDVPYKSWVRMSCIDRFTDALEVYEHADKLQTLLSKTEGTGDTARLRVIYKARGEEVGGKSWIGGMSSLDKKIDNTKPERVKDYTCMYASKIGCEQAFKVLCSLSIVPPNAGVPLRYCANLENGQTLVRLATFSAKPFKSDKSTFAVPRGLAKAENQRQVAIGVDKQGLDEMMNGFDLGRPLGKSKKLGN